MKSSIKRMLAEIEREVTYTRSMIGKSKLDPRVMAAIGNVSREAFVPPDLVRFAYDNGPLPIGQGQTISQPYIVALMTDLLQLEPDHIVLEVGSEVRFVEEAGERGPQASTVTLVGKHHVVG